MKLTEVESYKDFVVEGYLFLCLSIVFEEMMHMKYLFLALCGQSVSKAINLSTYINSFKYDNNCYRSSVLNI